MSVPPGIIGINDKMELSLAGVRGAGWCGEGRGLAAPPRANPPFSFRLRRKEKALFDGVKGKDAGGGISGSA